MTPWWVSILAAFVGALVGCGVRAWWVEYRDVRAARRLVVSELRANSRALRVTRVPRNQSEEPTDPPVASGAAAKGQEDFPEVLTDVGFRGVQLVLARRLLSALWTDLERVYSLLTPKVR